MQNPWTVEGMTSWPRIFIYNKKNIHVRSSYSSRIPFFISYRYWLFSSIKDTSVPSLYPKKDLQPFVPWIGNPNPNRMTPKRAMNTWYRYCCGLISFLGIMKSNFNAQWMSNGTFKSIQRFFISNLLNVQERESQTLRVVERSSSRKEKWANKRNYTFNRAIKGYILV